MEVLAPFGLVALLALPVIVFMYFLKIRRPQVTVATLMFWRPYRTDRQANAPWQRLRSSPLLLLQLAAALAIALALIRPGITGAAGVGTSTVVLLDGSASMQAADLKPSRFEVAVERARRMASELSPGAEMAIVLLGQHAELLAASTADSSVLQSALDRARPFGGAADLAEGLSLANAVLAGRRGGSIVLVGDGHSKPPLVPPRVVAPLTYLPMGITGENLGIEALSRTPGGSVFIRVVNYGRSPRDLRVELRADGRLVDVVPVHVDGNSPKDLNWPNLPAGAEVLEARLAPGDDFPLDDAAWLATGAPPKHRVQLVTAENGFLERSLRLRPGLEVTVVKPADYKPARYDLYVFDGFVPPGKLPEPALVVGPPEGTGPLPVGASIDPGGVLPANPRDPLLRDVVLKDIHVQVASKVTAPADWRPLISAVGTPLVLVHEGEPRLAEFTFDLHHSDLPLRAAFPVLIQNLLSFLLPGGFEGQVFAPGQPVTLLAEPQAKSLEITIPNGAAARVPPPYPAIFTDTGRPGVYTVRQQLPDGIRLSRFVIQFEDPSLSRIGPGAAPIVQEADHPPGPLPRGVLELWPWIAGAVVALLTLEWVVYHRGA